MQVKGDAGRSCLTSGDRMQAKGDGSRQHLMSRDHIWRPRAMLAVHAWRRLSDVHKPWPMRAIHGQHRLRNEKATTDVGSPRPTSPGCYVQSKGDLGRPSLIGRWVICRVHGQYGRPTLDVSWALCTSNVAWSMSLATESIRLRWWYLSSSEVCCPANGHTPRLMHASLHWWCMLLANVAFPKCTSLLMLSDIGQCKCHPTTEHTPRLMCASLANPPFHWPTPFVVGRCPFLRLHRPLIMLPFFGRRMSPYWWAYTTMDPCSPLLMMHVVG